MTKKDIDNIISIICPNDEDFEKPIISPAYLKKELEALALEQEPNWIPVSERLPNLDDYTSSQVWQKQVLITGYLSFDDTKEKFVSEAFASDVIYNRVPDTVITAWMPLPKPYEPQEKQCADCNHYGKLSLDCGRCDDDCSMYEPQESEDKG